LADPQLVAKSPIKRRAHYWTGRHQITPSHIIRLVRAQSGLLSSDLTDKECERVRLARLKCCVSTISLHFTDYPSEILVCSNSSTSYRVNVSVRMLLRPSCQYPQQSDCKHPATVCVPRRVAIEALHHGSPSCGPPGYNMRPAATFLICINCKNYAVI